MLSSFKSKKAVYLIAVILSAAAVTATPAALAQSSSGTGFPQAQNNFFASPRMNRAVDRPMKRYNGSQNYMYQTLELKSPVSAPYLPGIQSGSKYTGGVYYPRLKGRQCYVMRYLAKESAHELTRKFRDSLMQNGWQINEMQTNAKQLTATRKCNGLYLTFCVYPASKPGYKSSFEIKYLSAGAVQVQ